MNKVTLLNLGFIVVIGTGVLAELCMFLLDVAVKNLLLLLLATIACWLLYRATAATRHIVWTASLATLMLMPLFSLTIPQWNVLPGWMATQPQPNVPIALHADPIQALPSLPAPNIPFESPAVTDKTTPVATLDTQNASPESGWLPVSISVTTILAIWLVGMIACLMPTLVGILRLCNLENGNRNTRESIPSTKKIERSVIRFSRRLNINPPRIVFGSENAMPMVWQWASGSRLLLPCTAVDWNNQRLEIVLLHELVHLRRRDPLTLLIAQVARAANWFNPLALALRKQGKFDESAAEYEECLQMGQQNYDDHRNLKRRIELARTYFAFGMLRSAMKQHDSALENYHAAVDLLESTTPEERQDASVKSLLHNSYWRIAGRLMNSNRTADAIEYWDLVIRNQHQSVNLARTIRTVCLAETNPAQAVQEVQKLLDAGLKEPIGVFNLACAAARAASFMEWGELKIDSETLSVQLLTRALELGYFKNLQQIAGLQTNPSFNDMVEKQPFKEFLQQAKMRIGTKD